MEHARHEISRTEVESPRQSPGLGKSRLKRRAQRQYLSRFDALDVGKDDRPEIHGKSAKASVQVDHLAAILTATRGWVVTTALQRVAFAERKVSSEDANRNSECGMWKFSLGSQHRVASCSEEAT